jgi:hypothetical protein
MPPHRGNDITAVTTTSATNGRSETPSRRERVQRRQQALGTSRPTRWGRQRAERSSVRRGLSPHWHHRFPQLRSHRRSSSSMESLRGSSQRGQTRATNQRSGRVWRCSQNQQVKERLRHFMAGAPRTSPDQPGGWPVKGAIGPGALPTRQPLMSQAVVTTAQPTNTAASRVTDSAGLRRGHETAAATKELVLAQSWSRASKPGSSSTWWCCR